MASIQDLIDANGEVVMFIKSLINTPASAASILNSLRAGGLGIRTQTGYQLINYLRETLVPASSYIQTLGADKLPNVNKLATSVTNQLRNFAYVVKFTGKNTITGETTDNYITVSTNALLSKQQAIDTATAYAEGSGQSGNFEVDTAEVATVTVNRAGIVDV